VDTRKRRQIVGRRHVRGAVWLAALTMVGVACSGAPRNDAEDPAGLAIADEPDDGDDGGDTTGTDTTATTDGGDTSDSGVEPGEGTAGGGSTGGDASGPATTTGGGSGATSGGSTSTTGGSTTTTGADTTGADTTGGAPPPSGPYSAERATVGITDDEIYLCGHAALVFAEAFDVREEDLNIYWEMINTEQGGIHGRKVRFDWEDDAYNGNQAITAAQTCNARNPFVLLSGFGFDQIPGVRTWAENNGVPYIHHMAVEPTQNPTHSFGFLPSVEQTGTAFGEYIATRHGAKRVGIIALESENWSPGHDAAVAEMERRGVNIVHDFETARKGSYQQEIFALQQDDVEVVWVWENALFSGNIIEQANQQQYFPTWVVFPFQTTLDIATPRSPIEGVSAWAPYAPGGFGENDAYGHNADIELFEAAYATYRPGTEPNYLLYVTWTGLKAMHHVLDECGADCDRNRLHAMLSSGYTATPQADPLWRPNCAVDFGWSRSYGSHYGGFSFYAQEVRDHPGFGPAFTPTRYCWTRYS